MCMYLAGAWCMCGLEEGIRTPLKSELQMIVNCHVGAGKQTYIILCKSSKCFLPRSHLSMPIFTRNFLRPFTLFP